MVHYGRVVTRARALAARLLHPGSAGDAASASGRRMFANVALQLGSRVLTTGLGVVTLAVLARALGVRDFGVWTAALAFVGLFTTLTEMGLTNAATLGMTGEPEREGEWLGALTALRGLFSIAASIACAGAIVLGLNGDGQVRQVTLILAITLLSAPASALMTVFQSRVRSGMSVAIVVMQTCLLTGGVIVLATLDADVVSFAWMFVGVGLLVAVAETVAARRVATLALRRGRQLWRPLARVALPLGLASVLIFVYYRVDAVLLFQLASAKEAGVYGAAYRFLDPLTALPALVMGTLFPVLSAVRHSDPARLRRLVQSCADYMLAVSLPVLAVTLVLSGAIINLVYGPGFGRAAGVLPILTGAFVSICFGSLAGFLAPLLDLQWRLAIYSAIGAAANVGLNLVLIPQYGAFGSAWATLVTEVLTMMLLLGTGLRALHLRLSPRRMVRATLAAALMAGAMLLTRPLGLLPALSVGGLVYVGALFALRVVSIAEIRTLRAQRVA